MNNNSRQQNDYQSLFLNIESDIKNNQFRSRQELINYLNTLKSNNQNTETVITEKEQELLGLYDSLNATNKITVNNNIDYSLAIHNLEQKIKNNEFNSKEELNNYINKMKENSIPKEALSNEKIYELLELYDFLNKETKNELNLQEYKNVSLDQANVIISSKNDTVLKNSSDIPLPKEFRQFQNELTANTEDGLANADTVFDYMQDNIKKEVKFISIKEFSLDLVNDPEVLKKISFFITNKHIDIDAYKVNPENGLFYNTETQEIYEVRKNNQNDSYEIYRGGEKVFGNEKSIASTDEDSINLAEDKNEKEKTNENIKVRRLIKPTDLNSAAYVKSSFIVIGIIAITIILSVIYIINR